MNLSCIVIVVIAGRIASANDWPPTIASDDLPTYFQAQAPGTSQRVLVRLFDGDNGISTLLPVFLLKGRDAGPRLAITAALHGDEVTGVVVVQDLLDQLDIGQLRGDIIAIPVLNPFGFARFQRGGFTGKDINREFKRKTVVGEEMHYADRLLQLLTSCQPDYHVDLHTATTNNDNSYYVRADLSSPIVKDMAYVLQPQIILNAAGPLNSLRQALTTVGIHAVTIELGGPTKVNSEFVSKGVESLSNLLQHLQMIDDQLLKKDTSPEPVVCSKSQWICTNQSGLVFQKVNILDYVTEGDVVAEIKTMFGESVLNITAPFDCIVIGNTVRLPVQYGARIVHIGKVERPVNDITVH